MSSLMRLFHRIAEASGVPIPSALANLEEISFARIALMKLNEYFFQTYDGIGATSLDEEESQYFSEFHKYWEENHSAILNARVDDSRAEEVAHALMDAVSEFGRDILRVDTDTHDLHERAIAQVRFFTANQDFRTPPPDPYGKYIDDPDRFDAEEIYEDPEGFLRFLRITQLSQTDKRVHFARNAAKFLLDRQIGAYDIADCFGRNAQVIHKALVEAPNIGYGYKKANMFLRDMVEFSVWRGLAALDSIDVASDINTMKVALRTGIIRTDIPLLSSFLDVFCYQYGYIDEMSASAWRRVWEKWQEYDPDSAPPSPCLLDHLIYRLGKEYCKAVAVVYQCDTGHKFVHFGGGLKLCRVCKNMNKRSEARVIEKRLPCQIDSGNLPREEGRLLIKTSNLLKLFDGQCIFENVCRPKEARFRALNPPKSISIKGRTSWTSAYVHRDCGGGGMMS